MQLSCFPPDHEMLISIMFGQMDDAHLHMTSSVCHRRTELGDGAISIRKYTSRVQVGAKVGWH